MKQISASVFTEDGFSVPPKIRGCNPSYVLTPAGIVLIDTPQHPTDALRWRRELAEKGEIHYIFNTHHHIDHITGNAYLPGTVISHEGVRALFFNPPVEWMVATERVEEVARIGKGIIGYMRLLIGEREPECIPYFDTYTLRPPEITFSENLTLYFGGLTFQAMHMPGHTPSHICVYLPEEKIFFAGDNFTTGTQPSLAHSMPLEWVETLKKMEALDIDVIVPGHGGVAEKSAIPPFRRFLENCIAMVQEAMKKGMSEEEAASTISFEGLDPGAGNIQAVHPGTAMQRRNVKRLYQMLSKRSRGS